MSNRRKLKRSYEPCWAGRKAFLGGHPDWRMPCMRGMEPTHVITDPDTPGAMQILLCNFHYAQALASGLVTEHDPTPERIRTWEDRPPAT